MNNEKFVNVYIEILQKTLNDWLLQTVSLQANAKLSEDLVTQQSEEIQNLGNKIEELSGIIIQLQDKLESEKKKQDENQNSRIQVLEDEVTTHLKTISDLDNIKNQYENVKHQIQQLDGLRNELAATQEQLNKTKKELEEAKTSNVGEESLKEQIKKLQLENTNSQNIITQKNGIIEKINVEKDKAVIELKEKIDYLQLTPAKRKKFDEDKVKDTTSEAASDLFVSNPLVEDGGSF
jgi:chromosome segregation ATPase